MVFDADSDRYKTRREAEEARRELLDEKKRDQAESIRDQPPAGLNNPPSPSRDHAAQVGHASSANGSETERGLESVTKMNISEEDVIEFVSAVKRIGASITPNITGSDDATGGHVTSLTEAVMGITKSLCDIKYSLLGIDTEHSRIADAFERIADALEKRPIR